MSTTTPETEIPTAVESSTEETQTQEKVEKPSVFTYTSYIDLPGVCAAEEEKRGSCKDPEHFHAWVRLPNKFEHKDIRDKALAAKARKTRQLRSEGSDSWEILEEDMDNLLRDGDDAKLAVVKEILQVDGARDLEVARREVQSIESETPEDYREGGDDRPVYVYEHIDQDEKRLAELQDMAEDQRPADEYEELLRHVNTYYETLEATFQEQQKPAEEALMKRDLVDLVDLIRQARIRAEATAEFLHVYNAESWVSGTYYADKSGRKFGDLQHLKSSAPEVVTAIQATFNSLEQDNSAGNS